MPEPIRVPASAAHGGDGALLAASLGIPVGEVLDLSASFNPVAPPVAPLVAKHAEEIHRYPDPHEATAALASAIGVDPERCVLTNGGAEAIALVAAQLGSGWVEEPEFSLYRRHIPELDRSGPLFRSNPNNPTGALAAARERAAVWDEAFFPLATGTWTRGDAERGAWVLGSLTKLFACPGLRAGYLVAPTGGEAASLRRRQPEWSVNALVCASLPEMLAGIDLPRTASAIAVLRGRLSAILAEHGLTAEPSEANYLLVRGAGDLRQRLAARGVLVRDCANFGLAGSVRVAVPDEAGLERLDAALEAVL